MREVCVFGQGRWVIPFAGVFDAESSLKRGAEGRYGRSERGRWYGSLEVEVGDVEDLNSRHSDGDGNATRDWGDHGLIAVFGRSDIDSGI